MSTNVIDSEKTTAAAPEGQSAKAKRTRKASKRAKPAKKSRSVKAEAKPKAKGANKKAVVIDQMPRPGGATLPEIMEATGWQRHTVRGFVSILVSKGGEKIESSKNTAGERSYRIAR
jgi:hypothetical protein